MKDRFLILYRRDWLGGRFIALFQQMLHRASPWTSGERELFAAFSKKQCPFQAPSGFQGSVHFRATTRHRQSSMAERSVSLAQREQVCTLVDLVAVRLTAGGVRHGPRD